MSGCKSAGCPNCSGVCNNESSLILPIEIIDTDVDIDDSLLKNKSLYPIFLSKISFKNEKDGKLENIKSGSGHLVKNGI